MKKTFRLILVSLLALLLGFSITYGQADTQRLVLPPQPIQLNAGFDVIIKINGDIVYGLVKEVGLDLIYYQRTDIPDGPVYTILRTDVHAISYRNQVKEYFYPLSATNSLSVNPAVNRRRSLIDYNRNILFEKGAVRISLGFIKNYTKVDDSKSYSTSNTFPAVNVGYDVPFNNQLRIGVQLGFAGRKFANQNYSSYDSVQNIISIKENIFALYFYGKYEFMQNSSRFRPYIVGGVGFNNSRINTTNTVNFTNNNSQTLLVETGTHSLSLGLTARAGADYYINDQFQVFADGGVGVTALNIGLSITLQ